MNFASSTYLVFLAVVFGLMLVAPRRFALHLLLPAGLIFYAWWDYRFVSLLLISAVVDFACGRWVDREVHPDASERSRKLALLASISVNLGILFTFKYYDFFATSTMQIAEQFGVDLSFSLIQVVLPVGISFYTFQTMAYTIDVYRGDVASTPRLVDFMVYVSFFPQLVAGPIERAAHLLPQLERLREGFWKRADLTRGIHMIATGLTIKMVFADNFADFVDPVYRSAANTAVSGREFAHTGVDALASVYLFTGQIYCDFYGYTLIALGSAKLFWVDLINNFEHPYAATNIQNFWQRWHISLTRWFRDYVYIPLGGNRVSRPRLVANLFIIMFLAGLWHGANYTFVLWGVAHGLALGVHRTYATGVSKLERPTARLRGLLGPFSKPLMATISWLVTIHFVALVWVLFRAQDLSQAGVIYQQSWQGVVEIATNLGSLSDYFADRSHYHFWLPHYMALFTLFMAFEVADTRWSLRDAFHRAPLVVQSLITFLLGMATYFASDSEVKFIYFQF